MQRHSLTKLHVWLTLIYSPTRDLKSGHMSTSLGGMEKQKRNCRRKLGPPAVHTSRCFLQISLKQKSTVLTLR